MMAAGWVAGPIFRAHAHMWTSMRGGRILASTAFRAARSLSLADSMSGVWKAPEPAAFSSWACLQPSVVRTRWRSLSTAAAEPAHVNPQGKSRCVTWQTSPGSSRDASQSRSRVSRSRPATVSVRWGEASAASCMASPRTFTISRHVWKSKTPAKVKAAYSPSDSPATAPHLSRQPGRLALSFSMAARPLMYITGWHSRVSSSQVGIASGPRKSSYTEFTGCSSRGSKPRSSQALHSMACTAGSPRAPESSRRDREAWSGKSRPTTGSEPAGDLNLIFTPIDSAIIWAAASRKLPSLPSLMAGTFGLLPAASSS
mmetsp:Transcript_115949/g.322899  ORF Transcript_115949/g.322899 Transcript_115949/m.322899 type:complete len:314 (-) Transcript_115949:535-1476(-)